MQRCEKKSITIGNIMTFLISLCLVINVVVEAGNLSTTISQNLSYTVNQDLSNRTRNQARLNLRQEVLEWLVDNYGVEPDTVNPVRRLVFNSFFSKCLQKTEELSTVKGNTWVFILTLNEDSLRQLVTQHNEYVDKMALQLFNSLLSAQQQNNYNLMYLFGGQALYYCAAHLGPPIKNPAQSGEQTLLRAVETIMQNLFNKMVLRSYNIIIEGKPGSYSQIAPTITVLADSIPIANVHFVGILSGGKIIFTTKTGSNGTASFATMKIPYVSQGAFLTIMPNIGALIDTSYTLTPDNFGIKAKNLEQMMIFKIETPTYALNYKVEGVEEIIAQLKSNKEKGQKDLVPKDFTSDAYIHKFLRDSCHLRQSAENQEPDLIFDISCDISKSVFEKNEEIILRVTGKLLLKENSFEKRQIEKEFNVQEKSFEAFDLEGIQLGLFWWETANNLKQVIKSSIQNL